MTDLEHAVRRMLQALDAYWRREGSSTPQGFQDAESWWHRYEGYREEVETLLATKEER